MPPDLTPVRIDKWPTPNVAIKTQKYNEFDFHISDDIL